MEFRITKTEEKIQTIRLIREVLGTGLGEAKEYAEGELFTMSEHHDNCAELYLDLLATKATVETSRPLQVWQFGRVIENAEWLQHRLSNRIIQARIMLRKALAEA